MLSILLWAVVIFMFVKLMIQSKRQKKNKQLIDCVRAIKKKDLFFEYTNQMIENIHDVQFETKARVIKLWGICYHQCYDEFTECLNAIDMNHLFLEKKGTLSIDLNEDSFFYMYLEIPNILHRDGKTEYAQDLLKHLESISDKMEHELVKEIGRNVNMYYNNEGDLGLSFYERVLNGDYEDYTYSKTMIGLYKSIVGVMAAKIYHDQNNNEKYSELESLVESFDQSGVGHRWLDAIGWDFKPSEEKNEETFQITDESSKEASEDTEVFEITEESSKQATEEKEEK